LGRFSKGQLARIVDQKIGLFSSIRQSSQNINKFNLSHTGGYFDHGYNRSCTSRRWTTGGNNSAGPSDATDGAPINQLTAQAIRHTGQGKIVVQNNDDQGASRNLNLALDQLENM
jgi:hypothetical protein